MSRLPLRRATPRALVTLATLAFVGCEGAGEAPPSRAVEGPAATLGGDEGALAPVGDEAAAPPADRFVPAPLEAGREAARARSWVGAAALRPGGDEGRRSAGNWLCRLEALYGPPHGLTPDGFRYVLRDRETERVLVALLDAGGPAMGAVMINERGERLGDEDRTAAAVDAFVRRVDATRPRDCAITLRDGREIGVRGGRPFDTAAR